MSCLGGEEAKSSFGMTHLGMQPFNWDVMGYST